MRVLVTGASGFLGSHICGHLLAVGHEVTAFHRSQSRLAHIEDFAISRIEGDLADADGLRKAVAGHDAVIHAAADIRYEAPDAQAQYGVNAAGTGNVARACRLERVRRLVYVSSVAAIGIPDDPARPADETFPFNLEGSPLVYHLSKKRGEEAVLREVQDGLDAVIVNPASIFGPHGPGYRGGEMIRKIAHTKVVPFFRGGICAVHVDDVVSGIVSVLGRGVSGERYILGGENIGYREIARRSLAAHRISRVLVPVPAAVTWVMPVLTRWLPHRTTPARFTAALHYLANRFQFYSSAKARAQLGYSPRGFDDIVEECLHSGRSRFSAVSAPGVC